MRDDQGFAASSYEWLAELALHALGCMHLGIVRMRTQRHGMELVATAGVAAGQRCEWWRTVKVALGHVAPPDKDGDVALRLEPGSKPADRHEDAWNGREPAVIEATARGGIALSTPIRDGERLIGRLVAVYRSRVEVIPYEALPIMRATSDLARIALTHDQAVREEARQRTQLDQLQKRVRRIEGAIDQACHELKNYLTTPRLSAQRAQRKTERLAGAAAEVGETPAPSPVSRALQHATRLVSDLAAATEAGASRLNISPRPCDLGTIVTEAVAGQESANPQRSFRLDPLPLSLPVVADPDRIGQVVTNFLTNACKYSPADTPIEIKVQVHEGTGRVSVRDYGPGLPKKECKRVWSRFYRVMRMRDQKSPPHGLGLGLFISRNLIQRHDGQVGVESVLGAGATFWFDLPLASTTEPSMDGVL
jgi:signal transduction histidine kinase